VNSCRVDNVGDSVYVLDLFWILCPVLIFVQRLSICSSLPRRNTPSTRDSAAAMWVATAVTACIMRAPVQAARRTSTRMSGRPPLTTPAGKSDEDSTILTRCCHITSNTARRNRRGDLRTCRDRRHWRHLVNTKLQPRRRALLSVDQLRSRTLTITSSADSLRNHSHANNIEL